MRMRIIKKILKPLNKYSWEGNTGESIILHTTLGNSYLGAENTLRIRELSYHFVIDEQGLIRQLVDISRSAWHSGVKSNQSWRAWRFFGSGNANKRSIGISFVRNRHPKITDAQRDSAVWLIKQIGSETGVRYNANNIFYHREVTDYKPSEVKGYMNQVVEGLVGFKNEKDAVIKKNIITILMQVIDLLKKRNEQANS